LSLASGLAALGVSRLDTVAIIASNIPELIEAFYGVPMLGAVLNPLNTRLDAANIAFSLNHGGAKVIIVDREYAPLVSAALEKVDHEIAVIDIAAPVAASAPVGALRYEEVLPAPIRHSIGRASLTSGSRFAFSTPRARRGIRRASSTATAAPISRPSATASASG
jgi:acyl-CoA synthetase (AMP-forming)/AMP-acid ligase II